MESFRELLIAKKFSICYDPGHHYRIEGIISNSHGKGMEEEGMCEKNNRDNQDAQDKK